MHWKTKQKIPATCFIVVFPLLQWSGTELAVSLRSAYTWIKEDSKNITKRQMTVAGKLSVTHGTTCISNIQRTLANW